MSGVEFIERPGGGRAQRKANLYEHTFGKITILFRWSGTRSFTAIPISASSTVPLTQRSSSLKPPGWSSVLWL